METETFDAKLDYEGAKPFHIARDLASFANHLGGNIIVGAKHKAGRMLVYKTPCDLSTLELKVRNAIKDRCFPVVPYSLATLAKGEQEILVVNIPPAVSAPIAVSTTADKTIEGYGGRAWVFPIRRGSDTRDLTPEGLVNHMEAHLRRMYLLIKGIGTGERVRLCVVYQHAKETIANTRRYCFKSVGLEENHIVFHEEDYPNKTTIFPLDKVETIYRGPRDEGCEWYMMLGTIPARSDNC